MGNLKIGEIVERPAFGKRQGKASKSSSNKNGLPTHFALGPGFDNSLPEGEELRIKLDFTKGSELFKGNSPDEMITSDFFEALSVYRGITKNFHILIIFRAHWEESKGLAQAQSDVISRLAKTVQSFPGLKEVDVHFRLVKNNWSQMKNAVFFYRLNRLVPDWSLSHMIAARPWCQTMEVGSTLDLRLIGYRRSLEKSGQWVVNERIRHARIQGGANL